ncbi:hypothetical protein ACVBIO_03425 [Shewanella sp. 0m-8]
MSLVISPNKQQALSVKQQLLLISLPEKKRNLILGTLGRYERKLARERIRRQEDIDGKSFAPRKKNSESKSLKRLGKGLKPYVTGGNRLELKHQNKLTGRIAAFHQEGATEKMGAARMKRIHGKPDYDAPITRGQAKALVKLGAKARKSKGKGYRKATIKELTASMTVGQAEMALEALRNKKPKQNWSIPVKARSFLGDSTENVQRQLAIIIDKVNQR